MSASGFADVLGSPLIQRLETDSCTGCLFAYAVVPGADANQTLSSWAFYADAAPTSPRPGGNLITPILFSPTGTVLGIGTTQTVTSPGAQSYSFGLASGSNVIQAGDLLGWRDGGTAANSGNNGTISLFLDGGPGIHYYSCVVQGTCAFSGSVAVGDTFALENASTTARSYSAEFTTTPEPGFYGALTLGLGVLIFRWCRSAKLN